MRQSCYSLKQFLACEDNLTTGPVLPVAVDYGWFACQTAMQKLEWKSTYKRLFESSGHRDLALHEACIKGKIFEYVQKILPETPSSFEKLCWNHYGRGPSGPLDDM